MWCRDDSPILDAAVYMYIEANILNIYMYDNWDLGHFFI